MIFSRHFILVGLSLITAAQVALADRLDLIIQPGPKWSMTAPTLQGFNTFLEAERVALLQALPELTFPATSESFQKAFVEYAYAGTAKYRNRATACSFFAKVQSGLTHEGSKLFLRQLTKDGAVCIPADIPREEWVKWTAEVMDFFWSRPWIVTSSGNISLEGLISKNLRGGYVKPIIKVATNIELDAYGYAKSAFDLDFIRGHRSLSRIFEIASGFDPNDLTTLGDLGPEVAKLMQEHAYSEAQVFVVAPTIYMSTGWAPEALVEVLVHEYGHVYHSLNSNHFSGDDQTVTYSYDAAHNEGVAEAFAWMNLRDIYTQYPELEIFHIFKLKQMAQFHPVDPHYVGAGSLHTLFHSRGVGTFEELEEYIRAEKLKDYLVSVGMDTLASDGMKDAEKVTVIFH
jgi:hypothetical protein